MIGGPPGPSCPPIFTCKNCLPLRQYFRSYCVSVRVHVHACKCVCVCACACSLVDFEKVTFPLDVLLTKAESMRG